MEIFTRIPDTIPEVIEAVTETLKSDLDYHSQKAEIFYLMGVLSAIGKDVEHV